MREFLRQTTPRTICPECNGSGTIPAAKRSCIAGAVDLRCRVCEGEGNLTREQYERLRDGELMRKDRLRRGVSVEREARRLGISPSELAQREQGKCPEVSSRG